MEKRFIVKNLVSDYAVFDTEHLDEDHLVCICQGKRNADLIADILNTDYSKPNECTYYENELQQENTILKKALELACESFVSDEISGLLTNEEIYDYFIEQAKENKL